MSKKIPEETGKAIDRAILVGVDIYNQQSWLSFEELFGRIIFISGNRWR